MRLTEFLHQVNKYDFLIERDVVNAGDVKKWVKDMSARVLDPPAQRWFQSQLYQFLINRYPLAQKLREIPQDAPEWLFKKMDDSPNWDYWNVDITPDLAEQVSAVGDYINAWSGDNPGREPRMRWEQAGEQSSIWHREMMNATVSDEENEQDLAEVVTVYEFKDGFRWVDVNTEVCLKREGSRMGHCVGGYGRPVAEGTTKIFSLRSTKNSPHATLEATSEEPTTIAGADSKQRDLFHGEGRNLPKLEVNQVKGRGNKVPVAKYIPYVKEFLEWGGFDLSSSGAYDIEKMGLFRKGSQYLPLKDVSKVFKKYKDGDAWVKVDSDVEMNDMYDISTITGSPYKLVDSGWNIKASAKTTKQGKVKAVSTPYGATDSEQEEIKPKVVDLLNKASSEDEYGGLRKDWKIYNHDGKHGDLHDVAKKRFDLPNGNKVVEASNNHFVINDKNDVVFEFEQGLGDIDIVSKTFNPANLNMNYHELLTAITEITGEEVTNAGGRRQTSDKDDKPLVPQGEPVLEQDGISWHTGGQVPWTLPNSLKGEDLYIGYDKHKNPLYYVAVGEQKKANQPMVWHPDNVVEDVGIILGGTHSVNEYNAKNKEKIFKPGMDILNLILAEEWDTDEYDFKETMYEEFMWIEGDSGKWWMCDDSAPAKYTEIQYNEEGDQEFDEENENATLDTFWEATSLHDSGADIDLFKSLYVAFFDGHGARWDDRDMESERENPETGETEIVYYSVDYEAEFTGDSSDYQHPKS